MLQIATISATSADSEANPAIFSAEAGIPIGQQVRLTPEQLKAAEQGRLGLAYSWTSGSSADPVAVQWEDSSAKDEKTAVWMSSSSSPKTEERKWMIAAAPFENRLRATLNTGTGQIELTDNGRPVLQYNYKKVEPGPILEKVSEGNRIYARARSDYIHPLYNLEGNSLTYDWSLDHPHHRGVYWAWPEVEFGKERGDLHALQRVFARPTGTIKLTSGPVFTQVEAENLWLWEDQQPIVREQAIIRAYRAGQRGRILDLEFRFLALTNGVTVARRDTSHYGGLNIRLATPKDQRIEVHTDAPESSIRRAWSDLSGIFGGTTVSGLSVLQSARNPEYPGDWVQYPGLSWVQPTFPTSGTRYPLTREQPLILRFRLWVHAGDTPDAKSLNQLWDTWHDKDSPTLN